MELHGDFGGILLGISSMRMRMTDMFRRATGEDVAVAFFGASFFIGIWYAFPMVNTVTDVWAFGGGVLRAMEAHTLLPGYGVAYGTLSFYQNYLFMAVALVAGLPFYGFDVAALKTALILNPAFSLMVPRVVSALTAVAFLAIVYRFLKGCVESVWWRLALLVLVFGNVLAALLIRSGKMWILSTGLAIVSFIYLYRALTEERPAGRLGRLSVVSILTAFLATANFPFAAVFLANIPILFFAFPRIAPSLWCLAGAVLAGSAVFLFVFALNAQNTLAQVSGFVGNLFGFSIENVPDARHALTPLGSFLVNARQAIEAFPLLLIALIPAIRSGLRDGVLAYLSLFFIALYCVAVSVVFTNDDGLSLNVRHIFPLGFFLLFLLAAYNPPPRRISIAFLSFGLLIYAYAAVLLSIPTTYNAASDFIVANYAGQEIRIDEIIFELTLPMNKASYTLFSDESCGSTCQYRKTLERDIAFRPLVVTGESDPAVLASLPSADIVVVERAIPSCTPLVRFGNDVPDDGVFDMDINLGRMLMPSFYGLHQLGKNIYVYDSADCATL